MTDAATQGERIVGIERDVSWIRETLEKADLVNRVSALERGHEQIMSAIRTITSSVILLAAIAGAAKAAGVIP